MSRDRTSGGTFQSRLGELLLLSHAAGQSVEGELTLAPADESVPNVRFSVIRVDATADRPTDGATYLPDRRPFDSELESFVFGEYAREVEIDGVWTVRFARGSLPEWEVEIRVNGGDSG